MSFLLPKQQSPQIPNPPAAPPPAPKGILSDTDAILNARRRAEAEGARRGRSALVIPLSTAQQAPAKSGGVYIP